MAEENLHIRFTKSSTAFVRLEPSCFPWRLVRDALPEERAWCWVWDGSAIRLAQRVPLYLSGWMRGDTGADCEGVTHWQAIPQPVPPGQEGL